ncbi:unnamed protein product [Anisakis simplex]|uniref:Uncharacterized protein n=1 Tax=Anisakis simplex TaxID=6269 RepID=A0A0M3J0I8_ANISI|nr:unnamed protein product [Anisakis simplex]
MSQHQLLRSTSEKSNLAAAGEPSMAGLKLSEELCTPRRALGDMKNAFTTPMKSATKQSSASSFSKSCHIVPEMKRPLELFDVYCEREEHYTFDDLLHDSENTVDVSEVLRSVTGDPEFRYALMSGLFTKDELDWLISDKSPFKDDFELTLEDVIG